MIEAINLEAVHTHTHTGNFIDITKGKNAFINNEKIEQTKLIACHFCVQNL